MQVAASPPSDSPSLARDAHGVPLVSICVPVYNGQQFLPRVLDSLLAQTLTDFELLISDNASTDATALICEQYVRKDPRVRYIRQPTNIGAPRNWNAVARAARGRYMKWATANDEYAPTMLERCVAALEADPSAVLAQGMTCLVDQSTGARETYKDDLPLLEARPAERLMSLCMKLRLNNGQSGVIRASALRNTRFDRLYAGGDFVLMAELAMQGKFIVLPEVLFYRRMGPDTFSRALQGDEARLFYDPLAVRKIIDDNWRLNLDFLRSVITADIPLSDKLKGLDLGIRRMVWELHTLFVQPRRHRA